MCLKSIQMHQLFQIVLRQKIKRFLSTSPFQLQTIDLTLKKGNPLRVVKVIKKDGPEFNLYGLHQELIKIKKRNPEERTIIFEPKSNVAYDVIVKIMDEVRLLRNTDESIYIKDKKTRQDKKINYLFDDIIFGNIRS